MLLFKENVPTILQLIEFAAIKLLGKVKYLS